MMLLFNLYIIKTKNCTSMKKLTLCLLLMGSMAVHAQITSTKKGDIEFGGRSIAEMQKYDGSAETRPKFRMINAKGDTLVMIKFNKDLAFDWMTFDFKNTGKKIEVNTSEIIKGLNYQKNIGGFLIDSKLFDTTGNIDALALEALATKYNENLTEKYKVLNEGNRLVTTTKFEYQCADQSLYINGKLAGYAVVPANEQMSFKGVTFLNTDKKLVASGDLGGFGGTMKTVDGKEIKLGSAGKTTGCGDTMVFATNILRELFRNGYYR